MPVCVRQLQKSVAEVDSFVPVCVRQLQKSVAEVDSFVPVCVPVPLPGLQVSTILELSYFFSGTGTGTQSGTDLSNIYILEKM